MPTEKYTGSYGYDAATLRACWLMLVNQGGWWTSAELRHELTMQPDSTAEPIATNQIASSLSYAAARNLMTKRDPASSTGLTEYAVMPDNYVPKGMAVKHIVR